MGLFDMFGRSDENVEVTRSALDEAHDPTGADDAITALIRQLSAVGIDGVGPFEGAEATAAKALGKSGGNVDAAIDKVIGAHVLTGAAGGFVTSLGGFVTMAVAMPVNVFEFYVLATRMTASVASLRGYDLTDPRIRTAVLLTLVGSQSVEILRKAGIPVQGSPTLQLASTALPKSALMIVQKAVGFRIVRGVGERLFARAGKFVPVVGGVIGAGIDFGMMRHIGDQARGQFPAKS